MGFLILFVLVDMGYVIGTIGSVNAVIILAVGLVIQLIEIFGGKEKKRK